MNIQSIRRAIVIALALFVAIVPLAGLAHAAIDHTIPVYFHVIRRGTTLSEPPLKLSISAEDAERIGGAPFDYALTASSQGLTVQVSSASGTGKTMSAVLLGSTLESGVYSWYAVTVWPDGQTTTSPQALLTVR